MQTLSERQQRILKFIVQFFREQEFPPTIREIGETVGISSTSVVNYNLAKLEELQLLSRRREKSRGLSVNWERLLELGLIDESVLPGSERAELPIPARAGAGELVHIPVLGYIAAGEPILVEPSEASDPMDWLDLTRGLLGDRRVRTDQLFALKVKGDSMVDASVLDGDIVVLQHQERAENGEMVAVWIEGDDETTLKYWHLKDGQVHLRPANPRYEPIVREADKVSVKGRVVTVIRRAN